MWQIFLFGIRNVLRHPRRSILIGSAVAVVVLAQLVVVGVLEASRQNVRAVASTLFQGELNVVGLFKPSATSIFRLIPEPLPLEALVRQTVPELTELTVRDYGSSGEVSLTTAMHAIPNPVYLIGLDIETEGALRDYVELDAGRLGDLAKPATAILSRAHARRLDVAVGDLVTLSAQTVRGVHNTVDVQVVGIAAPMGSMSSEVVLVPRSATEMLYRTRPGTVSMLQLRLAPGTDLGVVEQRLRGALEQAGIPLLQSVNEGWYPKQLRLQSEPWVGQRYDLTSWKHEFGDQVEMVQLLEFLGTFLSALLLAISLAGLTNTLWVAIRERTREIGALRAIGMRRSEVAVSFVAEGMTIGFLGALAGTGLGVAIAAAISAAEFATPSSVQMYLGMGAHLELTLHPSYLWRLLWITTAFSLLGSLLPSLQAARRKPAAAMGHLT